MSDKASSVASDENAPQDERQAASTELTKSVVGGSLGDLIPARELTPVIDFIREGLVEDGMLKAGNIVPFPSDRARKGERGPQSVTFDDWQVATQGEYWERPSLLGFDSLRAMVEQTPILNAVVFTRVRQIQRFCRVADNNKDNPGFEIRHIDKNHELAADETESIELLNRFVMNCGWEFKPRRRKALKRDSFATFMAKVARDTLTLDSVGIETEWKRNKALGMDGFYAVDGGSIRLCTEQGYEGDDEIFALQVVQGRISCAYGYDDLIYEPRNPRTDVRACGYGLSETELLIRVVTGFLNAMTLNIKGFDSNAIPKGMLHLTGNYAENDINAFKRYWNSMVKGVNNAWSLPVMVSKDQESKASFEKFGVEFDEMYFAKWMTFLTSIICAIYGMSPSEINFDSFTGGSTSALSGSDTAEKLAASKDSGLRPVLSYFENLMTDYVVGDFSDKYVFRWTGLDPQDPKTKQETRILISTLNEVRAEEGKPPIDGLMGDAPLNQTLLQVYMAENAPQQEEDFGTPSSAMAGGDAGEGGEDDTVEEQPGAEQPEGGERPDHLAEEGQAPGQIDAAPEPTVAAEDDEDEDFGKSIPPVYVIE
jgi:hypothetical protein